MKGEYYGNSRKQYIEIWRIKNRRCFTVPMSNIPMIKTEVMSLKDNNAVLLNNGHFEYFDDSDEVILKRAKLVIDN